MRSATTTTAAAGNRTAAADDDDNDNDKDDGNLVRDEDDGGSDDQRGAVDLEATANEPLSSSSPSSSLKKEVEKKAEKADAQFLSSAPEDTEIARTVASGGTGGSSSGGGGSSTGLLLARRLRGRNNNGSGGSCCCRSVVGGARRRAAAAASPPSGGGVERASRQVWIGRILFFASLSGVAAVLGVVSHYFLTRGETELAETQFVSIADRALLEARKIVYHRRWSAMTMASVASEQNPDADKWPFVYVTGFERTVQNLLNASSGKDMGFVPFVRPEQQREWEEFAYDYYENSMLPHPFPNGTGVSSFGKGIWAVDKRLNSTDNRYHDTDDTVFTPVFHTDEGANPLLMFNVHFEKVRKKAIDNMIDCSNRYHANAKNNKNKNDDGVGRQLDDGNGENDRRRQRRERQRERCRPR